MAVTTKIAIRLFAILIALAFVAAACGGSDTIDASDVDQAVQAAVDDALEDAGLDTDLAEDLLENAAEEAEELAAAQEAAQAVSGGGGFTLTVGDRSWTFDAVRCAFGEEEIGQEGAEFVLSGIQDGLQGYVSIDTFGDFVSLDDISDFENPSVSLSAGGATIVVDGKNVSGTGEFIDGTSDTFEYVTGTFSGTCP